jgi:hypothetical protein
MEVLTGIISKRIDLKLINIYCTDGYSICMDEKAMMSAE